MCPFRILLTACLTVQGFAAHAGLTIAGSRIIFEEARGEIAIRIQHTSGKSPTLMQVWLDNGDPDLKPTEQRPSFLLTPAVARMNPGDVQLVRVLRTRDDLPHDRESVLYFNVLELPPAAQSQGQSGIQFATQARLKFFYRPKGLKPAPEQAFATLRFTLETATDGASLQLRVHNASPYHITLRNLALQMADGSLLATFDEGNSYAPMVNPRGELTLALNLVPGTSVQNVLRQQASAQVHYTIINDQGGDNLKQSALSHVVSVAPANIYAQR